MSTGRHRAHRSPSRGRRAWRALVVLATGVATVLLVAVAVNAVLTAGTGTGAAASATEMTVTLEPATGGADLKPGDSGELRLVATNPHPVPVSIRALALDTSRGTGGLATSSSACPVASVGVAARDSGDVGWRVPARQDGVDGRLAIRLPGAVTMSASAPDGCQGVVVTVYLVART